jgi:ABC-type Na+ efflux pump permease subunit
MGMIRQAGCVMSLLGCVFEVEWRTNARKPRFFWLRALYAGLLAVALANVSAPALAAGGGAVAATGVPAVAAQFFWVLALIQLLAVLLLTPAVTAATVAGDQERRALEPLLATHVRAADVVLGKLGARLLLTVSVLLPGVPALGLAVWLGGMPVESLLGVLTVTAVMVAATGAFSAWVSVHAAGGRQAVEVVYVTGAVLWLFPPLFALSPIPWPAGPVGAALRQLDGWLVRPNPVLSLVRAWQTGVPDWGAWRVVVAVNAAVAALCTFLAVVQVRRAALRRATGQAWRPRYEVWRHLRPRVGRSPVMWKETLTEPPSAGIESATRALAAVIGWGALLWMGWALAVSPAIPPTGPTTPFRVFALLVEPPLVCIGLLLVMARAATSVSAERERGTWDSLMPTPLSTGAILGGKLLGALLAARRVWLLVGLLWTVGVASGQLQPGALAVSAAVAAAVGFCAAALGLLLSLRLRGSLRALAVAAGVTAVVAGGYLLLGLPLLGPVLAGKEPPFWLLSPCVPFLAVGPMLLGVGGQANEPALLAACGTGGGLYGAAGLVLLVITWKRFDRWAGRSPSRPPH